MTVSQAGREALYAQQTDQVFLDLVELSNAEFVAPFYFVNNPTAVTSEGNVYQPYPFRFQTVQQTAEEPPQAEIRIDNTEASLVDSVRTINGPITVSAKRVRAADPETIEYRMPNMLARVISYDLGQVSLELSPTDLHSETACLATYNPADYPALFRGGSAVS